MLTGPPPKFNGTRDISSSGRESSRLRLKSSFIRRKFPEINRNQPEATGITTTVFAQANRSKREPTGMNKTGWYVNRW